MKPSLNDRLKTIGESNGTQINIINQELDVLKGRLDCFSDDYLRRAKAKQLKLNKHKAWKKRRKDRLKAVRQEKSVSHASIQDQPACNISAQTQHHSSKVEKIQQQPQEKIEQRQQQHIQQLTSVVEKLIHLRDLRRSKLEAKGHFFPETGDAFYNRIKSEVAAATTTENSANDNSDNDDKDKFQHHQKTIQPHVQDKWNGQSLDMDAYGYWLQGWENVDKLRRIREQWDAYLISDGRTSSSRGLTAASKIPPTMVSPSPPSSHLWNRYLE
ncbi:unnamed protein product [Absidia cylindrospora]